MQCGMNESEVDVPGIGVIGLTYTLIWVERSMGIADLIQARAALVALAVFCDIAVKCPSMCT